MKTGIFGGTFNPIHNGHIELADYCRNELSLDKVIFIPTFTPPHKQSPDLADSIHRLNMCRLAVEDDLSFEVSDIEIKRGGKSYTFETLISLKEKYPNDELYFITGADMFLTLADWRNPKTIFNLATIVAIPRNEDNKSDLIEYYNRVLKPLNAKAQILSRPVAQISSTFIRENIADYNAIKNMINQNVYDYIENNNLYRK